MTARGGELLQYDFVAPALDAALLAGLMRWTALALVVAATAWGLAGLFRGWAGDGTEGAAEVEAT